MEARTAIEYLKAIEVIEAQETLVQYSIADWPNIKTDEKKRRHRKLHKTAYPNYKVKVSSEDDIERFLKKARF